MIYGFNTIPDDFFVEIDKLILKLIWNCKAHRIAQTCVRHQAPVQW